MNPKVKALCLVEILGHDSALEAARSKRAFDAKTGEEWKHWDEVIQAVEWASKLLTQSDHQ